MKRIALLSSLIMVLVLQETKAQILKDFGVKTGISISKQNWIYRGGLELSLEKDYKTGLNFALNFEWFNNDYVTLITDIGYIQKGFQEEIEVTTVTNPDSGPLETFKTQFDYLNFTPQLKVRKEFNKIIPYVFLGPRIDYQLSYESDVDLSIIEKDFKKIILGFNYGLGITYRIQEFGLSLELTNFRDLTSVMDTQPVQNQLGLEIRSNTFTMGLGVNYYLK